MKCPSRRTVLGGTVSLLAFSAGCLSDGPGSESSGNRDGDDDASPDDGKPDDLPDGLADYETRTFTHADRSTSPTVESFQSRDPAENWIAERESTSDSLSEFVDATDFEMSILVSLEAGAPDPCHELTLDLIDIDESGDGDETLVLEGTVREASDENEACMTRETTVGRLVRATFESAPLTSVSANIVDRNGQKHGVGISSQSSSATASDSTSSGARTRSSLLVPRWDGAGSSPDFERERPTESLSGREVFSTSSDSHGEYSASVRRTTRVSSTSRRS